MIETSANGKRRLEIDGWNKSSRFAKRGLAAVPAKLGCGNAEAAGQAGATVSLLPDGSAHVVCGEVEIGAAMRHTINAFVAEQLGVAADRLKISAVETDAASASHHGDLHAEAVREACAQLRQRLHLLAARLLEASGVEITDLMELRFADGGVSDAESPEQPVPLGEVVTAAMAEDINVSATAYVNASQFSGGGAFREFAVGAASAEVLVDGFTGEVTVLRADVNVDVGRQIEPEAELGEVRGGFMQGLGWLTCEELVWSADGALLTDGADGYLVPTAGDTPLQFNVSLMPSYGSYPKSPGPAAFCLALAVREAVRDAVGAFGKAKPGFVLPCPATPEAVYFALHDRS
jgi:xanthine dehydrogenase large subunit